MLLSFAVISPAVYDNDVVVSQSVFVRTTWIFFDDAAARCHPAFFATWIATVISVIDA